MSDQWWNIEDDANPAQPVQSSGGIVMPSLSGFGADTTVSMAPDQMTSSYDVKEALLGMPHPRSFLVPDVLD